MNDLKPSPIHQGILDGNKDLVEIFGKERCDRFRKAYVIYIDKMNEADAFLESEVTGTYMTWEEKLDFRRRVSERFLPIF